METNNTKAICLKATDFGDNDKMLLLFSAELGKISAHIKGVKKAEAKLKFAAQPFCFGEYDLIEKNGRFLVTNCVEIESFFSVGKNVEAYYVAATEAEVVSAIVQENQPNVPLFVLFVRSLATLVHEKFLPRIVLIKFLLEALKIAGYGLDFQKCNVCGTKALGSVFVDMQDGGVVCSACKGNLSAELSPAVLNCFRQIENTTIDRIFTLKLDNYAGEILAILSQYIQNQIKKINSIQFLY